MKLTRVNRTDRSRGVGWESYRAQRGGEVRGSSRASEFSSALHFSVDLVAESSDCAADEPKCRGYAVHRRVVCAAGWALRSGFGFSASQRREVVAFDCARRIRNTPRRCIAYPRHCGYSERGRVNPNYSPPRAQRCAEKMFHKPLCEKPHVHSDRRLRRSQKQHSFAFSAFLRGLCGDP